MGDDQNDDLAEEKYNVVELPSSLEIKDSLICQGSPGAFCKAFVKKDTRFGPYKGEIIKPGQKANIDYRYAWEVFEKRSNVLRHTISASDPKQSNWMRHVNSARFYEEQNILSVQEDFSIYYVAMKDIKPGEELLTWFDPKLLRRTQRRQTRKERRRVGYTIELVPWSDEKRFVPEIIETKRARKKKVLSDMISFDEDAPLVQRSLNSVFRTSKKKEAPAFQKPGENVAHTEMPSGRRHSAFTYGVSLQKPEGHGKDSYLASSPRHIPRAAGSHPPLRYFSQGEAGFHASQTSPSFDRAKKEPHRPCGPSPTDPIQDPHPQMASRPKQMIQSLHSTAGNSLRLKDKRPSSFFKPFDPNQVRPIVFREKEPGKTEVEDHDEIYTTSRVFTNQCDDLCLCLNKSEMLAHQVAASHSPISHDNNDDDEAHKKAKEDSCIHFTLVPEDESLYSCGKILFRCDICECAYNHAYSLKRHYLRVHINHRYLSRNDIVDCQIDTFLHGVETKDKRSMDGMTKPLPRLDHPVEVKVEKVEIPSLRDLARKELGLDHSQGQGQDESSQENMVSKEPIPASSLATSDNVVSKSNSPLHDTNSHVDKDVNASTAADEGKNNACNVVKDETALSDESKNKLADASMRGQDLGREKEDKNSCQDVKNLNDSHADESPERVDREKLKSEVRQEHLAQGKRCGLEARQSQVEIIKTEELEKQANSTENQTSEDRQIPDERQSDKKQMLEVKEKEVEKHAENEDCQTLGERQMSGKEATEKERLKSNEKQVSERKTSESLLGEKSHANAEHGEGISPTKGMEIESRSNVCEADQGREKGHNLYQEADEERAVESQCLQASETQLEGQSRESVSEDGVEKDVRKVSGNSSNGRSVSDCACDAQTDSQLDTKEEEDRSPEVVHSAKKEVISPCLSPAPKHGTREGDVSSNGPMVDSDDSGNEKGNSLLDGSDQGQNETSGPPDKPDSNKLDKSNGSHDSADLNLNCDENMDSIEESFSAANQSSSSLVGSDTDAVAASQEKEDSRSTEELSTLPTPVLAMPPFFTSATKAVTSTESNKSAAAAQQQQVILLVPILSPTAPKPPTPKQPAAASSGPLPMNPLPSSVGGPINLIPQSALPMMVLSSSTALPLSSSVLLQSPNSVAGFSSVTKLSVTECTNTLPSGGNLSSFIVSNQAQRAVMTSQQNISTLSTTLATLPLMPGNAASAQPTIQPNMYISASYLTGTDENHQPADLYRCHMCVLVFKTTAELKHHIKNDPHRFKGGIKQYACDQCSLRFRNKHNLSRHNLVHHPSREETTDRKFRCLTCGKGFTTENYLKMHARFHLGKSFPCKYGCRDVVFPNAATLVKHLRTVHPGLNLKEYIREKAMKERLIRHHGQSSGEAESSYSMFHPGIGFQAKRGRPKGSRNAKTLAAMSSLTPDSTPANGNNTGTDKTPEPTSLSQPAVEMRKSESETQPHRRYVFKCKLCPQSFSFHLRLLRHRSKVHGFPQSVQEFLYEMSKDDTARRDSDNDSMSYEFSPPPSPKSFFPNINSRGAENMQKYIDGGLESVSRYHLQELQEFISDGDVKPPLKLEWTLYNFTPCFQYKDDPTRFYDVVDGVPPPALTEPTVPDHSPKCDGETLSPGLSGGTSSDSKIHVGPRNCDQPEPMETNHAINITSEVADSFNDEQKLGSAKGQNNALQVEEGVVKQEPISDDYVGEKKTASDDSTGKKGYGNVPPSIVKQEQEVETEFPPDSSQLSQASDKGEKAKGDVDSAYSSLSSCSPGSLVLSSSTSGRAGSVSGEELGHQVLLNKMLLELEKHSLLSSGSSMTSECGKNDPLSGIRERQISRSKYPWSEETASGHRSLNSLTLKALNLQWDVRTNTGIGVTGEIRLKAGDTGLLQALDLPVENLSALVEKLSPEDLLAGWKKQSQGHAFSSLSSVGKCQRSHEHHHLDSVLNISDSSKHDHRRYSIWSRQHSHKADTKNPELFYCPVVECVRKTQMMREKVSWKAGETSPSDSTKHKAAQKKKEAFASQLGLMTKREHEQSYYAKQRENYCIKPPEIWKIYDKIWFGKKGSITVVCSICHRHFSCLELCLRHQWKKHPHIEPLSLAIEKGNYVEDMYYYYPMPYGILAHTQLIPDDLPTPEVYVCTRCAFPFKNLNKLHSHITVCDPNQGEATSRGKSFKKKKLLPMMDRWSQNEDPVLKTGVKKATAQTFLSANLPKTQGLGEVVKKGYVIESVQKIRHKNEVNVATARRTGIMPGSVSPTVHSFMTSHQRRNRLGLLYNPSNHSRRRELYQVLEQHQCHGCNLKFKSMSLLERHVKKCSGRDKLRSQKPLLSGLADDAALRKQHTCRYCNKRFTYIKGVDLHYKRVCSVRKVKEEENKLTEEDLAHEAELQRIIEHMKWSKSLNKDSSDIILGHVRVEEDGTLIRVNKKRGRPFGKTKRVKKKGFKWTTLKRHRTDDDLAERASQSGKSRGDMSGFRGEQAAGEVVSPAKRVKCQNEEKCPREDLNRKRKLPLTGVEIQAPPPPKRKGRPPKAGPKLVVEKKPKGKRGRPRKIDRQQTQQLDSNPQTPSIPTAKGSSSSGQEASGCPKESATAERQDSSGGPAAVKPPIRKRGRPKKFDPSDMESSYKKKKLKRPFVKNDVGTHVGLPTADELAKSKSDSSKGDKSNDEEKETACPKVDLSEGKKTKEDKKRSKTDASEGRESNGEEKEQTDALEDKKTNEGKNGTKTDSSKWKKTNEEKNGTKTDSLEKDKKTNEEKTGTKTDSLEKDKKTNEGKKGTKIVSSKWKKTNEGKNGSKTDSLEDKKTNEEKKGTKPDISEGAKTNEEKNGSKSDSSEGEKNAEKGSKTDSSEKEDKKNNDEKFVKTNSSAGIKSAATEKDNCSTTDESNEMVTISSKVRKSVLADREENKSTISILKSPDFNQPTIKGPGNSGSVNVASQGEKGPVQAKSKIIKISKVPSIGSDSDEVKQWQKIEIKDHTSTAKEAFKEISGDKPEMKNKLFKVENADDQSLGPATKTDPTNKAADQIVYDMDATKSLKENPSPAKSPLNKVGTSPQTKHVKIVTVVSSPQTLKPQSTAEDSSLKLQCTSSDAKDTVVVEAKAGQAALEASSGQGHSTVTSNSSLIIVAKNQPATVAMSSPCAKSQFMQTPLSLKVISVPVGATPLVSSPPTIKLVKSPLVCVSPSAKQTGPENQKASIVSNSFIASSTCPSTASDKAIPHPSHLASLAGTGAKAITVIHSPGVFRTIAPPSSVPIGSAANIRMPHIVRAGLSPPNLRLPQVIAGSVRLPQTLGTQLGSAVIVQPASVFQGKSRVAVVPANIRAQPSVVPANIRAQLSVVPANIRAPPSVVPANIRAQLSVVPANIRAPPSRFACNTVPIKVSGVQQTATKIVKISSNIVSPPPANSVQLASLPKVVLPVAGQEMPISPDRLTCKSAPLTEDREASPALGSNTSE